MTFKLENKLPHINQLLHIFFAVILLNALTTSHLNLLAFHFHHIIVTFTIAFFIGYTWWRQNDMYLSAVNRNFRYVVVGLIRIVLISILVNMQESLYVENKLAAIAFMILSISLCLLSIWQFAVTMRPTYGKVRVLLKREIWTDAIILAIVAIIFIPFILDMSPLSYTNSFMVLFVSLFFVRPIAKMLTRWKEAAPPHRGGKGRASYSRTPPSRKPSPRSGNTGSSQPGKRPQRASNRNESSSSRNKNVVRGRKVREVKNASSKIENEKEQSESSQQKKPAVQTARASKPNQKVTKTSTRTSSKGSGKKINDEAPTPDENQAPKVDTPEKVKGTKIAEKVDKMEVPENDTANFGKRNVKKRRPSFEKDESVDEEKYLKSNSPEPEVESEANFGRTPKRKTR